MCTIIQMGVKTKNGRKSISLFYKIMRYYKHMLNILGIFIIDRSHTLCTPRQSMAETMMPKKEKTMVALRAAGAGIRDL